MKKIFLATSFSGHVDYKSGKVNSAFRTTIEEMLRTLRSKNDYKVFCAVEHEDWIISDAPPEVGVKVDLSEIKEANIFLALLGDKPSEGLQFEMGYAVNLDKIVVAATKSKATLGYFNSGLANMGVIHHISYVDSQDLMNQIKDLKI